LEGDSFNLALNIFGFFRGLGGFWTIQHRVFGVFVGLSHVNFPGFL